MSHLFLHVSLSCNKFYFILSSNCVEVYNQKNNWNKEGKNFEKSYAALELILKIHRNF